MVKRRMASVLTFLFLLLWLDREMSTAVTEARLEPRRSVAARAEDDDRQSTHPALGPANERANSTSSCPTYEDTADILKQLVPCLPAVSIVSTAPDEECCSRLHEDGLTCLCSLFAQYRSRIPRGIIKSSRIVELPNECNLPIPDGTTCDGVQVPSTPSTTEANAVQDSADKSSALSFAWVTRGFTFHP